MYIDIQQDADTAAPAGGKTGLKKKKTKTARRQKKSGKPLSPPLKKNSQKTRSRTNEKEIQMLRNHASTNIGSVGFIVNSFVTVVSLTLIGATYFAALGQFVA